MEDLLSGLFKEKEKSQVVVITGATAGVGRATAREFAKKGYKIGLVARGRDGLEATKNEIEQLGGSAIAVSTDVADYNQVELAAEKIEQAFGPIDIWINNAMASVFSPISEMKPEEFKRVTDVTYHGQVYGTLVALKRMKARNKGSIVFVGSALAYRGIPLQSAYCAAKHAVQGFFDSLRTELIHENSKVEISLVELPALNTPQFGWVKSNLPYKARPMGKIYQPEVAATAIVHAAENSRREMYVGSTTVQAIVGDKLVPFIGDYYLAKKGVAGQQTNEPEDPNRSYNLWEPVSGDHGAHGTFGDKAHDTSVELWFSLNMKLMALAGLAAAAVATGLGIASVIKDKDSELKKVA